MRHSSPGHLRRLDPRARPTPQNPSPLASYQNSMASSYASDSPRDHSYAFVTSTATASSAHNDYDANESGTAGAAAANDSTPKHTRSYQACNACRARKTKCVMGNPDRPHDGPCQKCARERKKCVFEATRKKTKGEEDGDDESGSATGGSATGNSKKRTASDASFDEPVSASGRPVLSRGGMDSGSSSPHSFLNNNVFPMSPLSTSRPSQYNNMGPPPRSIPPQSHLHMPNNFSATHALHNKSMSTSQQNEEQFRSPLVADVMGDQIASSQQGMQLLLKAASGSIQDGNVVDSPQSDSRRSQTYSTVTGRGSTEIDLSAMSTQQAKELRKAISVWSRMRFIRAGWFTPQEAMTWVDYFYQHLAPMTPVSLPDFRAPGRHHSLLVDEPVLALTILTIASRQLPLRGAASMSRSHNVHDKLWTSLRAMVERLLWGQEQFGGGFCGAGTAPVRESDTGQISWKGSLRTLGTIEALLVLTDWQPRALHFPPPGDDEGHLVDESVLDSDSAIKEDEQGHGVPFAFALEPAWRSDRMSWMLLGLAQSLSYELGVFNENHDACQQDHGKGSECVRKRRICRLVHTYVSQTSGRLGIRSMLRPEDAMGDPHNIGYADDIDAMHDRWLELARIMYDANRYIFLNHTQTRELTRSGEYKEKIRPLAHALARWRVEFDKTAHLFHPVMRDVLMMEYNYSRMFINSLGFNKVVESWRASGPQLQQAKLVQITEDNKDYINEVRDASTNLVVTLLNGFAQKQQLRNAAIRTYLRSFSGMVFTLKLFSLGNHETVVRKSLNLLERVAAAMEAQVVDDVHISNMIAEQVKTLTAGVTRSMIRIQKPGGSNASSREQSLRHSPVQLHANVPGSNNNAQLHQQHHQAVANHLTPHATTDLSPDPLAEIQARPIADYSEQTFMPPPNMFSSDDPSNTSNGLPIDPTLDSANSMQFDFSNTDWFTLPLDNMLANAGGLPVEPGLGGVGPSIGDKDLLEFLAPSDSNLLGLHNQDHWGNLSGSNGTFGFDGF